MYIVQITFISLTQNSKGEYQINGYKKTMHEKISKNLSILLDLFRKKQRSLQKILKVLLKVLKSR